MGYTSPTLSRFRNEDVDVQFDRVADSADCGCGLLDDPDDMMLSWPDFEERETIIPRNEWADRIAAIDAGDGWLERLVCKIKNQGREGSCVYNAAAQLTEIVWNKQFGVENWVELSPISGYRNNARGPNTGSNVGGSLDWMTGHGLIPVDSDANKAKVEAGLFQHTHPATGYYARPMAGWPATAKLFRVHEWLKLTSVEAWVSALLKGFPCSGGRDRHCICHVRPLIDGRNILSLYANSWGAWGATYRISTGDQRGFGVDTESKIQTMVSRGAWCARSVLVPPWLAK